MGETSRCMREDEKGKVVGRVGSVWNCLTSVPAGACLLTYATGSRVAFQSGLLYYSQASHAVWSGIPCVCVCVWARPLQ